MAEAPTVTVGVPTTGGPSENNEAIYIGSVTSDLNVGPSLVVFDRRQLRAADRPGANTKLIGRLNHASL